MGRNQRKKVNQKRKKRRIFPSLFLCACQRAVNRCADCRTANTRRQCDFTFFSCPGSSFAVILREGTEILRIQAPFCLLRRHFPFQGNHPPLQKLSKQTLKFSPAFFKRRRNPKAAPLVALRTGRNPFLQGSAGGEAKQSGGLFCRGEPSPGVPRIAHTVRFYLYFFARKLFCTIRRDSPWCALAHGKSRLLLCFKNCLVLPASALRNP